MTASEMTAGRARMWYCVHLGFVIYLVLLSEMLNPCNASLHKAAKCCIVAWGNTEGPVMEKHLFKLETKQYH